MGHGRVDGAAAGVYRYWGYDRGWVGRGSGVTGRGATGSEIYDVPEEGEGVHTEQRG